MSIEDPISYAEWYWHHSIEAIRARDSEYEQTLSPFIGNVLSSIPEPELLPSYVRSLFNAMASPSQPEWSRGIIDTITAVGQATVNRILGHELKEVDYSINRSRQKTHIVEAEANLLYQRKKIVEELWKNRNYEAGYNDAEMVHHYEASKPYPNIAEIIQYARYNGPPDSPKELAWSYFDIPDREWTLWEWLSRQKLNTEQVFTLFKQGWMSDQDATTELARLGWQPEDRQHIYNLIWSLPNPMLLTQGALLRELPDDNIKDLVSKGDIHPAYAEIYIDGILTKPASTDIIAYELRRDPSLSNLSRELRRIGIHPNYHGLYQELAYEIPPVQDIITMAVREAFTPEIAQRFGQYEGLPQEFVEWSQKKGLTREWAERYWAAHWSLPSPTQGFEMLHRGIISRDDLSLLLRALDIMPFWRDRLIQMSYRVLTRVDVRRMYNLGVLTEAEVNQAYRDLGYDNVNAARMTTFTVKLLEQQKKREAIKAAEAAIPTKPTWTAAQTLTFVKKGLITQERARLELSRIGYDTEHTDVYLASAQPET